MGNIIEFLMDLFENFGEGRDDRDRDGNRPQGQPAYARAREDDRRDRRFDFFED